MNEATVLAPGNELQAASHVEIDLRIGINEVTDIVVSQHEDKLLEMRKHLDGELETARKKHAAACGKLEAAGKRLVAGMPRSKRALDLAAAIKAFNGTSCKISVCNDRANVEKAQVEASLRIFVGEQPRTLFDLALVIPFTGAMKKIVNDMTHWAEVERNLMDKQLDVSEKLADMPRLARRARCAVVEAQLRGLLTSPEEILNAVFSTSPKALPAS